MSAHLTCAACQKMYHVIENGSKDKVHYYGLCPACSIEDQEYKERKRGKNPLLPVREPHHG